ncbi:QueF [Haloarcula californiae tailed virus 1]|uniref:QueF n=1 Tax=Haloarcula californiae tailed virus 1 TaxID=1273746 RepID=R4TMJ1_9CAUD|nr:GTP cyclohydrolase [Haloarcula californiae tailed virus 1]AGM11937.1 QueF [Haloarcula californiae tailed virus 1]
MADNEVTFRFNPDYDPIDSDVLQAVPNPRPDTNRTDRHVAKEFSTNCPVDYGVDPDADDDEVESEGVRDYGEIEIEYRPDDFIVELKSLKYYLMSFEDARISHEEVTAKVFQDLAEILYPDRTEAQAKELLHVRFDVNPRGGISSDTWVGGAR